MRRLIVFHQLERNDLVKIVDLEVAKVIERIRAKVVEIHLDTTAVEFLIDKGYDSTYGARPMRRAVEKYLEDPFGSIGYAREELRAEIASMIIGPQLGIGYDPGQHAAYAASWIQILEDQPFEIFMAAADGEKIHTYLQSLQQQQSLSGEELEDDKSDIIKEYDRLVKSPEARRELEKQNPGEASSPRIKCSKRS